ncbi:MAG: ribonuclease HII [Patescibacteria group bacterium]|nr:ribonuclease HII [Patescibacteria group bacterium]
MKYPNLNEEKNAFKKGYNLIIGLDEVGRGAFAGPVVVGAVALDKESFCKATPCEAKRILLTEINDSKKIRPNKRKVLAKEIKKEFIYSIATTPVSIINKYGIGKATAIGFRKAVKSIIFQISRNKKIKQTSGELEIGNWKLEIPKQNCFVLVDGFHIKYIKEIGLKNQKAIIKGDQKCVSIAASSIIAKVHRDSLMKLLHKKYPNYHFSKNKGYGTKEHQNAIKKYGLSKIHRKSFNLTRFTF